MESDYDSVSGEKGERADKNYIYVSFSDIDVSVIHADAPNQHRCATDFVATEKYR